jgi:hypothetical protein
MPVETISLKTYKEITRANLPAIGHNTLHKRVSIATHATAFHHGAQEVEAQRLHNVSLVI